MNKQEYLASLRAALACLPESEIEESVAFYTEMIDDRVADGLTEEEAEAEITGIEDEIKARMTELDTDELRGGTCKVTWKQVSSTRIDSKALKKELPDIAAKYSSTSTYRRFLIA